MDALVGIAKWLAEKDLLLGTFFATIGWLLARYILDPQAEQRRLRAEIIAFWNLNADLFSNPATDNESDDFKQRRTAAVVEARRLSGQFVAAAHAMPRWARACRLGTSIANAKDTQGALLGFANSQWSANNAVVVASVSRELKLWKALGLTWDAEMREKEALVAKYGGK